MLDAGIARMSVSGALATVVVSLGSLCGCVERKLLIESDPADAMVFIDEEYQGVTPLELPFTFYHSRQIEIRKEGFRPERFMQKIPPPFYEIFPLDFIIEVIMPFTLVDEHRIERRLAPESPEIYDREYLDALRQRAEEFRER